MDISFFGFLLIYFWIFKFYPDTKGLYIFFAFINMLAWIRGLNHLKIFESSRIFISLLFEVIADIKGFSIILLACLLAFSSTYDILC
jgi:hypothetical protein